MGAGSGELAMCGVVAGAPGVNLAASVMKIDVLGLAAHHHDLEAGRASVDCVLRASSRRPAKGGRRGDGGCRAWRGVGRGAL